MAVRTEKTRRSPSKSGGEKKPRVIEARGQ
jgi:hypothetical protein